MVEERAKAPSFVGFSFDLAVSEDRGRLGALSPAEGLVLDLGRYHIISLK